MEKTMDLLAKIKAAKDAKHLSYQDIADLTEKNGEAVSLSTVRRIFSKDACVEDFRYNQTIRPIVRAVLGIDEDEVEMVSKEDGITTIEAMKALIDFKHAQYEELLEQYEKLKADLYKIKCDGDHTKDQIEQNAQRKIDFLCDMIEDLKQEIKWYKKVLFSAVVLFAFFYFSIVVFVFLDHFVMKI